MFGADGYRTSFYHPGDAWFYNRENVYRWLGAEHEVFAKDMKLSLIHISLAAISAVSRVDVLTRRPGDTTGSAIHGEGGHMEPVREEGAPEGTTCLLYTSRCV